MVTGIIGKKVGMTQLFLEDGTLEPATVLQAGPCIVVQSKSGQTDGYDAVQLGLVEKNPPRRANKATVGHHKKANVPATRVQREVKIAKGADAPKPGDQVLATIFNQGERVDVIGDLASRRGKIQSQEDRGGTQIISARVPLSDMFGYATDLRSRTQGRATYSMHFDRYEQAPRNVSDEVVARVQGTK